MRPAEPPTYLQRLVGRPETADQLPADDGPLLAYHAVLDRALEDRQIDPGEADALVDLAHSWGITAEQVRRLHSDYIRGLAAAAVADGVVTDTERRDLHRVAELLGMDISKLDETVAQADRALSVGRPITQPAGTEVLTGQRVCFTGELCCRRRGQAISRDQAEELARAAGLVPVDSVTKKLDLLVVADPHTLSGKAKKARQYGIRVMPEPVFWRTLGIPVE